MTMRTSFTAAKDNIFSRKFGGTGKIGVADPYVTGYHFIWFDKLPTSLISALNGYGGISGATLTEADVRQVLAATCLSVTPPGGTLNKVEYTGLGGVKWAVPGNVDYGNTVSVKFFEFNKTPILDIMHGWVKMIRDYRTGASDLVDGDADANGYTKATYAGLMYYWTTAPDGLTVEYYACYDGVFPSKDPQDLFTSDVETVGRLDVEIEFNVDYAWHEKWVFDKCKTFAEDHFKGSKDSIKQYQYK